MDTPSSVSARLIGSLLVEKGVITDEQLQIALTEQEATGRLLGELLVDQFGVTREALASALELQQAENESNGTDPDSAQNAAVRELARMLDEWGRGEPPPRRQIGEIFVEKGFITLGQLADALEEQKLSGRKLGEILVSKGDLSRLRLWDALEDQAAMPDAGGTESMTEPDPATGLRVAADALTDGPSQHVVADPTAPAAEAPSTRPHGFETWKPKADATVKELELRIEQLEQAGTMPDTLLGKLREDVVALSDRLDALAGPEDEWRDALAALTGRIEDVVSGAAASAATVTELTTRLDALAAAVATAAPGEPTDDVSADLDDLRATIEALPTRARDLDPLRERVDEVAATLADKVAREESEALRRDLDSLRAAVEALPVQTGDVEALRLRIEQVATELTERATGDREALRRDVAELRAVLDGLPDPGRDIDDLNARISSLATADQAAGLRRDLEQLRSELDAVSAASGTTDTLDALDRLTIRVDRLSEALEAATSREDTDVLRRELDTLHAAVTEARQPDPELARLAIRLDELAGALTATASRADADELRHGLEELRDSLSRVSAPSEALDILHRRLDEVASTIAATTREETDRLRRELGELRSSVQTLPASGDDVATLRDQVERVAGALEEHVSHAASHDEVARLREGLDELRAAAEHHAPRGELTAVVERVDELFGRFDAATTAEQALGTRVDELSDALSTRATRKQADALRHDLDMIARSIDALPSPTEAVGALSERIDHLAGTVEASATRSQVDALRHDLDSLRAALESRPAPSEEWRDLLAELGRRVDDLVSGNGQIASAFEGLSTRIDSADEADTRHAERLDSLAARLHDIGNGLAAAATTDQADELRNDLAALRVDLESIPPPSEEWRDAIASLAVQLDEARAAANAWPDAVAALATRIDELPPPSEEWREGIETLTSRLREHAQWIHDELAAAATAESVADAASRIDEHSARLDELTGRQAHTESRLDEQSARHEEVVTRFEEHDTHRDAIEKRLDQLGRRADGLAPLRRVEELLATASAERETDAALLTARLDGLEQVLAAAQARIEALEPLAARVAELEPLVGRIDELETRIGELSARERAQRTDLEGVRRELTAALADVQETAAEEQTRTQGLSRRVDDLEDAVTEVATWPAAVEPLQAQLADLAATSSGFAQRIDALASASADRAELEQLRNRLEEEIVRMLERQDQDDAASEAAARAIRDGLAQLAERLTASEQAYLESGQSLRRSIETLGLALADANEQLRPPSEPTPSANGAPPAAATHGYVAFVPGPEGHQLVECDGETPYLGQIVELPAFEEQPMRVSRIARSPLPFDDRPCAYLEPLSA